VRPSAQRSQARTNRSDRPNSAATAETERPPRTPATASSLKASGKNRRRLLLSAIDTSQAVQPIWGVRESGAGPKPARRIVEHPLSRGALLAVLAAKTVGSWRFIIIQSVILGVWIVLNVIAHVQHWDPYPFILLNLVLSFQAAYAAPIIMMSQNRQSEIDRRHAQHDYRINVKAELGIEMLHNKIDALRQQEMLKLIDIIQRLSTCGAGP
jgi:hypothetical protein